MSEKKFCKTLIKSVKKHPILYDAKCKGYRNVAQKNTTWKEIGVLVGRDVEECRKQWKRMRDRFGKEAHKLADKHIKDVNAQSEWKFFKYMEFLNPHLKSKVHLSHAFSPQADRTKHVSLLSVVDNQKSDKIDDGAEISDTMPGTSMNTSQKLADTVKEQSDCSSSTKMDTTEHPAGVVAEKPANDMREKLEDISAISMDATNKLADCDNVDKRSEVSGELFPTVEKTVDVTKSSPIFDAVVNMGIDGLDDLLCFERDVDDLMADSALSEHAETGSVEESHQDQMSSDEAAASSVTVGDMDSDDISSICQPPSHDEADRLHTDDEPVIRVETTAIAVPTPARPPASKDVTDVFGELVACKLKSLGPDKSNAAMKHIFHILWQQ